MVRIVATSDTHTLQKKVPVPDGDVFIHCGDMGNLGRFSEYRLIGEWFESLKDRFKHRIIVAGNHDAAFQHDPRRVLEEFFDPDIIYLQDKGVEIEGFKIYGTPWMPAFMNWAFMLTEKELKRYYDAIPDDTNILITHSPANGILDRVSPGYGHRRCGSSTLADRIKELPNLTHHLFGHLHYSYGHTVIDGVNYHNVAALNEDYEYANPPQVIDL